MSELDPVGLAGCLDYICFPLLLAVDSIATARLLPAQRGAGVRGQLVPVGGGGVPAAGWCASIHSAGTAFLPEGGRELSSKGWLPAAEPEVAALPAMASDQAAEAALSCLCTALERCGGCSHVDQLLGLLQRLAAVAALPPSRASEEVRRRHGQAFLGLQVSGLYGARR